MSDFGVLYDSAPGVAENFANYMQSTIKLMKDSLPQCISDEWKSINSFADIGGGSGYITFQICKHHPHLKGVNGDLKQLLPVYNNYLANEKDEELAKRVSFREVDFFAHELPSDVDAHLYGNVLHDWDD